LALYVLASFARDTVKSSEAGLKYFVLGHCRSGMLLYGASLNLRFRGDRRISAQSPASISTSGMSIGLQ